MVCGGLPLTRDFSRGSTLRHRARGVEQGENVLGRDALLEEFRSARHFKARFLAALGMTCQGSGMTPAACGDLSAVTPLAIPAYGLVPER